MGVLVGPGRNNLTSIFEFFSYSVTLLAN